MWTQILNNKPINNEVQTSDNGYYDKPSSYNYCEGAVSKERRRRLSLDSPTRFHLEYSTSIGPLEDEYSPLELKPCPICNRNFNTKTYDKHVVICSTTSSKKRKTFDSSRQRREGTELARYSPKNFGLPSKNPDKTISPKLAQIVYPMKKEEKDVKTNQIKVISPVPNSINIHSRQTKASKRTQPPPSEQCPHCERFFGNKAYDRHVEWCKEKAIQQAIKNPENINAAKGRLNARTKYKAPSLRSKRTVTREKYSPSGVTDEDENLSQKSTSLSKSSSYIDDREFLDCYDPFTSAKRQLEELCSPTLSTKSFFDRSSSPIQKPIANLKVAPEATKTNFRRTHSLRSPRKPTLLPSRPVFLLSHNYRPTVQRGLSDEGPISTSFLKPEEYDEMPVRAVCQNDFAITNSPRIIKRGCSASNRRETSSSNKHNIHSDFEKNSEQSLRITSNIDKSDSLSIFLDHEHETKTFDNPLSVKDLKDKSNALSKQNSSMELSVEKLSNSNKNINLNSVRLEPIEKLSQEVFNEETSNNSYSIFDQKGVTDSICTKLINICDNLSINVTNLSESDITSESSTPSIKQYNLDSNNRNSADGNNLRKRKMLLDRNQLLYDATPDPNNTSFGSTGKVLVLPKSPQIEEFDVQEFLSSFENGERDLPLFKDCQDFLTRHLNQSKLLNSNNLSLISSSNIPINMTKKEALNEKLDCDFECDLEEKETGEIFICIETDQNENFEHPAKNNPLADNPKTQVLDIADNKFSKIEDEYEKLRRNNEKNLEETVSYQSIQNVDKSNNNLQEKRRNDSAYGSLSRQSLYTIPHFIPGQVSIKTRPATAANPEMMLLQSQLFKNGDSVQKAQQILKSESSNEGSESYFPPINLSRQEIEINADAKRTAQSLTTAKMSKFCHECGNKFVVETAKFCMECGIKRIAL